MRKFTIPKLRISIKKIPSIPGQSFFAKIGRFFMKVFSFFSHSAFRKVATVFIISLAVVVFLAEATFAVFIYGLKDNNVAVKTVSKYIPLPVVLVGTHTVSLGDYNFERTYIEHFYNQAKKEIPADVNAQITDQLIESKILEVNASKYDVKISKEEIDSTIDTLTEQSGGKEEVEKVLANYYGLNMKSFRVLVKNQLLRLKMQETVPKQLKASHILIKAEANVDEKTNADAKAKADGILAELKAGTDFATKAKEISDDTGSRDQGGELGWFGFGDMVKPFEETAFKLEVNQISDPIRTDFGWHIIKITEQRGTEPMSYEDWLKKTRDGLYVKQLVVFK